MSKNINLESFYNLVPANFMDYRGLEENFNDFKFEYL